MTCKTFTISEIERPEGFDEVIRYIDSKFTTFREWNLLQIFAQMRMADYHMRDKETR